MISIVQVLIVFTVSDIYFSGSDRVHSVFRFLTFSWCFIYIVQVLIAGSCCLISIVQVLTVLMVFDIYIVQILIVFTVFTIYLSGSDHINVVWYLYCSGSDRENGVCKDGSDQAYCLHTIYTGSFLNTTLGLREYFSIKMRYHHYWKWKSI